MIFLFFIMLLLTVLTMGKQKLFGWSCQDKRTEGGNKFVYGEDKLKTRPRGLSESDGWIRICMARSNNA